MKRIPPAAGDWAQFQGPRGDGTSPERIFRRERPAEGPPVLSGGRLFVRTPYELVCYDGAGK